MAASQQLSWTILPAPPPDTPSTAISGPSSFWAADNAHQLSRPSPSSSSVLTAATSIPPGSSSVVSSSFSAPPRSKRALIVGGGAGLVSRRVTNLSPALEEDETSVFGGSPSTTVERTGSHRGATRRAAEAIRVKAALWENSRPELDGLGSRSSFDEMSPSSTPTKQGTQPLRVAINPRRATNESPIPSSTSTPHQRVPTTLVANAAPRSQSSPTPSRPVRCPSLDFPRSSTTSSAALPASSAGSNSRHKDQQLLAFPSSAPPNITSFGSSAHPPSPTKSSFASPSTNTRALITRFESPLATPGRGSSPQTLHIRTTSEGSHPFTLSRFHLDKPLPPISPQSRDKRSPLRDGFRKLAGKFGGAARRRRKVSGGGWSSGGSDLDEDIDMQIPGRLGLTPVQGNTPEKEATDIAPLAPASHSIDLVRREAWVDMDRSSAETLRSSPVEPPKESQHQATTAIHSRGLHSHQASISSSNSTKTIRTGSLLHYSAESFPPRWVRTTATLYPGSLVLSFLSLRGDPTTRTISLVMCESVRTVPEKESRVRWANPIGDEDDDDDEGEVHYLELFWAQDAGQQPVVVAVESIAERLAWVSSIWDSILGVSPLSSSRSDSAATFQAVPTYAKSSQDSPQESALYMPPRQPPGVLSDPAQSARLSLYTEHSDENQTSPAASASTELSPTLPLAPQRPEQMHCRRTPDNGPPRLSRPKLSGKVNDLRLSVERMLGESFTFSEDGSKPMKAGPAGEGFASEGSSHTTGSSSISDAERMEDPSPLVPMAEAELSPRLLSQSHHGGFPIPPYSSTRSTHLAATRDHRSNFVEFQHSGNEVLFSPSEGPPPSLVGSEAPSFDMSDLNPSRSASQVQRRVTGGKRTGGDKDGLTYVQRRQQQLLARQDSTSSSQGPIEVLAPAPKGSSLLDVSLARSDILTGSMISPYHIARSGEASPLDDTASDKALTPTIQPKPALSATTPVPVSAAIDPTSILQHTSANEAHSAARAHSLDAKLSSVQADVAQLLLPTLEQQGQLARLEDMLVEMGDDLKELVVQLKLGGAHRLSGETTAALEATPKQQVFLQEMCVKLDDVLDRLNVAPETPSTRGEGVETPRPLTALTVEGASSFGEVLHGPPQRLSTEASDAAAGPDEAAQAVADGGSKEESFETACSISPAAPQAPAELVEALQLIKDQSSQRAAQTQQTSDIARYLNELNSWMEQFVKNGNKALDAVSNKVDHLRDAISPPPPPTPQLGAEPQPPQQSITGLLQQLRDITLDLRDNSVKGAGTLDPVQQRLEDVLAVMEQDRQRFMNQNNAIDSVVAAMERQRVENHTFLQAMVVDLKSEIQGERLRFVDAMHHATSVNVNTHVEEFKQLLSQEVARSLADLGRMREEKKSLEQQIAELFAIKVKHSMQIGVGLPSGGASPAPRRASLTRPPPPIGPPPAGPPPSVPRGPSPFQRGASPHHF